MATNEDGIMLEMHSLVQFSTQWWLEEYGLQGKFKELFVLVQRRMECVVARMVRCGWQSRWRAKREAVLQETMRGQWIA